MDQKVADLFTPDVSSLDILCLRANQVIDSIPSLFNQSFPLESFDEHTQGQMQCLWSPLNWDREHINVEDSFKKTGGKTMPPRM